MKVSESHTERYRIVSLVGEGRTCLVYYAEDTLLGRHVAMKTPRKGLLGQKPHYRDVFEREARYLAILEHPNIVPLYEFCESEQGPVLVLRYVHKDLQSLIGDANSRKTLLAARLTRQVAAALDYCTAEGICHRDVKLDNVLIDDEGQVYLTDFGLAGRLDDEESWLNAVGAKPYVSPEILLRELRAGGPESRKRCDQFSLGVLMYQILTGCLPHAATEGGEEVGPEWEQCTALRLIRGELPVPCCERDPEIPSKVDEVLGQMLSVDPRSRFPSNTAAAKQLADALGGRTETSFRAFVSYWRHGQDAEFVRELVNYLEKRGLGVWWAPRIEAGEHWDDQIEDAMLECHAMVVVLSHNSVRSAEVKSEWRYWMGFLDKPLLTLVLDDCRIPYRLFPKQHLYVAGRPAAEVASEVAEAVQTAAEKWAAQNVVQPAISTLTSRSDMLMSVSHIASGALILKPSSLELLPGQPQLYVPQRYALADFPMSMEELAKQLSSKSRTSERPPSPPDEPRKSVG